MFDGSWRSLVFVHRIGKILHVANVRQVEDPVFTCRCSPAFTAASFSGRDMFAMRVVYQICAIPNVQKNMFLIEHKFSQHIIHRGLLYSAQS